MIVSLTNKKIKDAVKLRSSSARKEHNLFVFEGAREIKLALDCGIAVKELYVCRELFKGQMTEILKGAWRKKINIYEVNRKVYDKLAYGNRRDGLVVVAEVPAYALGDIRLKKNPLLVVAQSIEKPGNLGAMLRTVDAYGVDNFIVSDIISDVYNHYVVRSSIGTIFTKPVVSVRSKDLLLWLKKNHISVVCADPKGPREYTLIDFKKPTAIILGSEKKGLGNFWKHNADVLSYIPMKGKADSLNVSITAAAFIFEAIRQRS